jgi:hypothetical protein
MKRLLFVLPVLVLACSDVDWAPASMRLPTRWSADVSPTNAHPEYPRPMKRRAEWKSLNGLWDYAIGYLDPQPQEYDGKILVPYPIESALSGVADTVGASRRLWYRTSFEVPDDWAGRRVLLHFEAVDWETMIWVNGQAAGFHRGGYDPFTVEISGFLVDGDEQELTLSVWDPTDAGTQARGKQVAEPGGIFYTSVTGIWQTVWIEPIPDAAIGDFVITPDIDRGNVLFSVEGDGTNADDVVEVTVIETRSVVATARGGLGVPVTVDLSGARLWSPDDPFLYDVELKLVRNGEVLDSVETYFGMRKTSVGRDADGVTRLLLNNEFVFQLGPLDQGYWPDGLYTAPTERAMVYDLEVLKSMGFNMLRKHVKVEPRTFYAWCDRMGLLVWQDMPNANIPLTSSGSGTPTSEDATGQFEAELVRVIETLQNHPSIVMWVPFNEGWGQYESSRIVDLVRTTDPTRLVNHASGWHERGVGDVVDRHHYPDPEPPAPEPHRAAVQGEYGGLGFNIPGHMWQEEGWGYALFPDRESLTAEFEDFLSLILNASETAGLSAAVYTQTTDIETENNGLMTYDREVSKIEAEDIALAMQGYLPPRVVRQAPIFLDQALVEFASVPSSAVIRYTTDGSIPSEDSPQYERAFEIFDSATVRARVFWQDGTASRVSAFEFTKAEANAAEVVQTSEPGLVVDYYVQDGSWRELPDFELLTPTNTTVASGVDLTVAPSDANFGLRFRGYLNVLEDGVYGFHLTSDDGSRLFIDGTQVVDNDGIHGARERSGHTALTSGLHPIELVFFQGRGGVGLALQYDGPGLEKREVGPDELFHR